MQISSTRAAKHRREIGDTVMSRENKSCVMSVRDRRRLFNRLRDRGEETSHIHHHFWRDSKFDGKKKRIFFFPVSLLQILLLLPFIPNPSSEFEQLRTPGSRLLIPTPSSGLLVISLIPIILNSKLCLSFSDTMNRIL